ncbi:hypothetical protein [Priestia megaterium]|uniref:hypothetical protein n=1 Tax=Priestia megaterium TaxID=1404 RepID=UPI003008882C
MTRTEKFIESLEEWKVLSGLDEEEYKSYLGEFSFLIGGPSFLRLEGVDSLKQRIDFLINDQGIKEVFLIYSLVQAVTEFLEKMLRKHGEVIINNESMISSLKKDFGEVPESHEEHLKYLKDKKSIFKNEMLADSWKIIINKNFTFFNERNWEYEDVKALQRK